MGWLHAVIDVPADQLGPTATFWSQALGWPLGEPWADDPELRSFAPPDGDAYVHLGLGADVSAVLLHLEVDQPDAESHRLTALGASAVAPTSLHSPGGLPFCLVPRSGQQAPGPVTWAGGHRSRLVQVCVDCPADTVEAELAFWHAALTGRWRPSDLPEFLGKFHDDAGSPIQLLFQRLDQPTGLVRAHLDLGTDDLAADAERLERLGAVRHYDGHGWVALRDPAGLPFCTTSNLPVQTRTRDLG